MLYILVYVIEDMLCMCVYIYILCMLVQITCTYIYTYILTYIHAKHISSYPKLRDKKTGLLEAGKGSPSQFNSTALAIQFHIFPSLRILCLL